MAGTTWQARARRWFKAHRLVVGVVLGLLVITGVSSAVWVTASKGSKEADLGSSLFSGLVVGVALLIVGKMFDNTARHAQYERTRQSSGESIVSTDSVEVTVVPLTANIAVEARASAEIGVTGVAEGKAEPPPKGNYQVVYEGAQRDRSRVDAQQVRLRLFRITPGEDQATYVQFVTVPVPSPDLRSYVGSDPNVTEGRLWWHIAHSIEPQLKDAIRRGEIPTPTPQTAYEATTSDLAEAVRQARLDSDPAHDAKVNQEIYRFRASSLLQTQVLQIIGYESGGELERTGAKRYDMVVTRDLTVDELAQLRELADYNGVQLRFLYAGRIQTVGGDPA